MAQPRRGRRLVDRSCRAVTVWRDGSVAAWGQWEWLDLVRKSYQSRPLMLQDRSMALIVLMRNGAEHIFEDADAANMCYRLDLGRPIEVRRRP